MKIYFFGCYHVVKSTLLSIKTTLFSAPSRVSMTIVIMKLNWQKIEIVTKKRPLLLAVTTSCTPAHIILVRVCSLVTELLQSLFLCYDIYVHKLVI